MASIPGPGSAVCPTTKPISLESEARMPYGGESIFPKGVQIAREGSSGRLTAGTLENIYNNLTNGPSPRLLGLETYNQRLDGMNDKKNSPEVVRSLLVGLGEREKKTMDEIQNEFCYNFVRYQWSLNQLFAKLVETSKKDVLTDNDKNEIQKFLNLAKEYNQKLNDIIQLTNFIAAKRASEMGMQNTRINELNNSLSSMFNRLANTNQSLRKEDALVQLRQRMVEYTQEKNASAANLLGLYGFLNLVALGLLFYISQK